MYFRFGGNSGIIFIFLIMKIFLCSDALRGKRINIHTQNGGDITQLRRNMGLPKGVMFNALPKNSPYRWTRYKDNIGYYLIPYIITGKFDKAEKEIIAGAMVSIERNTCIRFKPRKGEEDFLDLHNKEGEGCYTTVGRMPGQNIVMLESNNLATCIEHDIVIHELMHTIGLWHEHMRYDRDDYIKVHYENIDPTYNNQFDKISHQESTTYGIKYDYKSVMHYARDAFSKKLGLTTMETLDKSFINTIGHVQDASPNDYLKICAIYGCSKCMGNVFDLSMLNNTNNTTSKKSITRATRYPPRKITPYISTTTTAITTAELADLNTTTLSIITYPPDCPDEWFCINMVTDWNRGVMCNMPWIKKWCCASCKKNFTSLRLVPR